MRLDVTRLAAATAAVTFGSIVAAQSPGLPKAEAKALWDWLQAQNYQTTFMLFPGKEKMYPGREPHGAYLSTYVNAAAFNALRETNAPLPVGAVLVKENYLPNRQLAATTVMYKVAGYDPAHNNWFWMKRNADGKVEAAGKVDSCIACHASSTTDYVMTEVTALPTRLDTPALRR